jgi:hypothetical protein
VNLARYLFSKPEDAIVFRWVAIVLPDWRLKFKNCSVEDEEYLLQESCG